MSDSEINKIHNNILTQISNIYDKYQQQSRLMKEQNNKKTGSTIDKAEKDLLEKIQTHLEPELQKLTSQMDKVKALKGKYSGFARSCHSSIKNILKKKAFNFKVNKQINDLYDQTMTAINFVRSKITIAEQTPFLCCGVDGKKQFEAIMNVFRIQSGKWEMIQILQSKGSVDNFISPQFKQGEFQFIKQTLKKNWPKDKQPKVQYRDVQKIVTKVIKQQVIKQQVSNNPLIQANQYLFGINREQNPSYALSKYIQEADKNNNADACSFLGTAYEEGVILPKNIVKATSYYKKAMQKKHKYATYRFALCLIRGIFNKNGQNLDDVKKGFSLITQIATAKDSCAQALTQLGHLYAKGSFTDDPDGIFKVDIDLKKAISYNQQARKKRCPRAANNLGIIYFSNRNMNPNNPNQIIDSQAAKIQNTKKALSYFYEAQKLGYSQAYFNLGVIFKEQKQPEKAYQYFYEGGRKGDYLSRIKFAYELMNQTSIQKQQFQDHYRLAQHWLEGVIRQLHKDQKQISSKSGLDKNRTQKGQTLYYLGLIYQHGFGVQKSPKRAFNYFLNASQISYGPAKNKIGDCYFSGYGVSVNRQLAIGCYIQAAQLNNCDSMVNLGTIYLNGIPGIVQRNYNKAHQYFCKAMELQNSDAMIHLSYMYRNGLGLDNDDQLAKKLLQQAAKNKNATALYMLKERGEQFDKNIYYDNLQNEFFSPPKRLNISQIIPLVSEVAL